MTDNSQFPATYWPGPGILCQEQLRSDYKINHIFRDKIILFRCKATILEINTFYIRQLEIVNLGNDIYLIELIKLINQII